MKNEMINLIIGSKGRMITRQKIKKKRIEEERIK